jgi:hypothetical protein
MVHNFQHNWETSPQFRALWSGGLGLTIVVMLCACLGVAFTFAGTVAARMSGTDTTQTFGPPPAGTPHGCGADCNLTFPTPTVPSWAPPLIPQGQPIPPSLTPAPTPTAMPTPTPVPTAVPGPPCTSNCGGSAGTVTITSTNPSPLKQGTAGSVVIHTSQPNVPVVINITWQTGGFAPYTNNGAGYPTDANGDFTLNFTVPSGGCTNGSNNAINFWITAGFPGGTVAPTITERCSP